MMLFVQLGIGGLPASPSHGCTREFLPQQPQSGHEAGRSCWVMLHTQGQPELGEQPAPVSHQPITYVGGMLWVPPQASSSPRLCNPSQGHAELLVTGIASSQAAARASELPIDFCLPLLPAEGVWEILLHCSDLLSP